MQHGLNKAEENQETGLVPCPFKHEDCEVVLGDYGGVVRCKKHTRWMSVTNWNHRVQGSGEKQKDSASRATQFPQIPFYITDSATPNGVERIVLERQRQLEIEGWTPETQKRRTGGSGSTEWGKAHALDLIESCFRDVQRNASKVAESRRDSQPTSPAVPKKSKCCNAPLKVDTGDEGTSCYICTKCGKPSDPVPHDCLQEKENKRLLAEAMEHPGVRDVEEVFRVVHPDTARLDFMMADSRLSLFTTVDDGWAVYRDEVRITDYFLNQREALDAAMSDTDKKE